MNAFKSLELIAPLCLDFRTLAELLETLPGHETAEETIAKCKSVVVELGAIDLE